MQDFFENVLTASLYGSVIILCLLLLRPLLKKLPKKYLCLLWLLAIVRLLIPFDIQFHWSLQPDVTALTQPQAVFQPTIRDLPEPVPAVPENASLPEDVEVVYGDAFTPPENIPEGLESYYPPAEEIAEPVVIDWNTIGFSVWAAVAAAMVLYSILSFARLNRKVREAVHSQDGAWECAGLETAFILGWVRPRVYLPMGLTGYTRHHILRHEKAHLRRKDHWLKLLGFLALSVHWFNPLMWAAWVLLCRDMELACDEQVVKDMGFAERKDYSAALLRCSTRKEHYLACPVAFGEVSVKTRILSVLNYRRPRFWSSLVGIVAILFVAVFLMTSPAEEEPDLSFLNYKNAVPLAAEQKEVMTVYYVDNKICPATVDGGELAKLLDTADWRERWTVSRDQSSPGSVDFLIEDGYDISLFDRRFARVKYGEEVRYYRIPKADYETAVRLVTDPVEKELTDEEILIERCQIAMEAIMYADSYHIAVSMDYTGSPFMPEISEAEYWKYQGNRLSRHYPDSDTATSWLMEWNGNRFKKLDCATWVSPDLQPYDWVEADFDEIDEDRILPWFHFVDWNRDTFTVQHHTASEDTEEIILNHCADNFEWTLSFLLDKDGRLLSIDRSLKEFDGQACSGTVTTTFISFNAEEVTADFEQIIERNPAVFLPDYQAEKEYLEDRIKILEQSMLLQRCYDALAWHQVQGWRWLHTETSYSGEGAPEDGTSITYCQTPERNLRVHGLLDDSLKCGWLIEQDGTIYCMGLRDYFPEGAVNIAHWVEVTDPEPGLMTTWLEEYQWDFSQIEFISSRETDLGGFGGTYVTFRVKEPITDHQGGTADYHDVEFVLTEADCLYKVTDSCTIQNADGSSYQADTEISFHSFDKEIVAAVMAEKLARSHFPY